jgi:polyhydroxyalkanoate synthase
MSDQAAWDVGERAANVLAPESDLFAEVDMVGFGRALAGAARGAAPVATAGAVLRLAGGFAQLPWVAVSRWLGGGAEPPVEPDAKDRRFRDPAWSENPLFYATRQSYLLMRRFVGEVLDGAAVDAATVDKARLAADFLLDAVAPTNLLVTNPAALKRAFDTGGVSLVRGARHFVDDLLHNQGRPRQVDISGFRLGENLAATAGKVVYRNELMELIQYAPQTEKVRSAPLLCSPPWINKYYVMDLAPGRSFIEWAVQHQRTVFAISYVNPSAEMSATTMDDYLINGPRQALDVISAITGADTIDIVGLCLGGALTAITDAYLSQAGDTRVGTLTLLNTMLDYARPGQLSVFTDERTLDRLEQQMAKTGHLEGRSMAGTFDLMRANDLIFNYVVSNWLMGQDPPAFDILAWNADSTRMPAAMHAFYLRNFYLDNKLAKGELEIAGRTIDLGEVKSDTYIVSAENDHIVPWTAAYASTGLLPGPSRFILSSGGHIAGIVNPPGPKGWYLTVDDPTGDDGINSPADPAEWRAGASRHAGSWWEDWVHWSDEHSGELVDPPSMGSRKHPPLEDAPGGYVRT